jgi:hypothetical protein
MSGSCGELRPAASGSSALRPRAALLDEDSDHEAWLEAADLVEQRGSTQ